MIKTLSPKEEKIVGKIIEVFSNIPEVEAIILYGSRARGDSDERSDIDILILSDGELKELERFKSEALRDIEDYLYVSLITYRFDRFMSEHNEFVKNVKREGIILWKRKD